MALSSVNGQRSFRYSFALAFLVLIGVVFSAGASLQFDVFPGFDGQVRQGHWYPVTFEIKNEGPTFSGFVQIDSSQMSRNQLRRVPIELPTGTLKRVMIPMFSSGRNAAWTAQLVSERGKVLEEVRITPFQNIQQKVYSTVLLGSISRTPAGTPNFPAIKSLQKEIQPDAARLLPNLFPDSPIVLDGLQCIYVSSHRAPDLKLPQVQALLAWLQDGGHLVVGVEQITDVNGTPWLRELLPCSLDGMTKVPARDVFQNWLRPKQSTETETPVEGKKTGASKNKSRSLWAAAGTNIVNDSAFETSEIEVAKVSLRDGKVLASVEGSPLAIESRHGRGKVTTLLFSPERRPFLNWQNRSWFWAMLTDVPPRFYDNSDSSEWGFSVDGVFGAMIESRQVRKLPLMWLLALLIVYLLVIGPIDQYWLKKINRQMLTWVTFPCYVIFFSGLIYFIGFHLRAGESEWNELNIVDVYRNGEKAILRGRTFASIYSPSNQRFPLEGPQFIAALRGEYMANYGQGEENSQATVNCVGNKFSAEIFVPVWTSQLYVNDWWQPIITGPPLSLTVSDNKQVTVENLVGRKLTEGRICLDGKVYTLGDLPPGKSEFALEEKPSISLADFVRGNGSGFQTAVQKRRETFGHQVKTSWNLPLASMAASFAKQLDSKENWQKLVPVGGLDLNQAANNGDAILFAWDAGQSLTAPMNRFTPRRSGKNTLLRLTVPRNSLTQSYGSQKTRVLPASNRQSNIRFSICRQDVGSTLSTQRNNLN